MCKKSSFKKLEETRTHRDTEKDTNTFLHVVVFQKKKRKEKKNERARAEETTDGCLCGERKEKERAKEIQIREMGADSLRNIKEFIWFLNSVREKEKERERDIRQKTQIIWKRKEKFASSL